MASSQLPHLLFAKPLSNSRIKGKPQSQPKGQLNSEKQSVRVEQRLSALELAWKNQTAALAGSMSGQDPEMVLVMEIVGTIDDFFRAIKKTPGMDFLGEYDDDLEIEEEFEFLDSKGNMVKKPTSKRVFLSIANQQAIAELRTIWNSYKTEQKVLHHKYKDLFQVLTDIRPYGLEDRLLESGIREYLEQYTNPSEEVNFEVELVYKNGDSSYNELKFREFQQILNEAGGQIVEGSQLEVSELHYHALVAKAPASCFSILNESTNVGFLKSSAALAFRPVGQSISILQDEENLPISEPSAKDHSVQFLNEPVAALLDGMPISNHVRLAGRLHIDDPDGYEENYLARHRLHGTSMASLIIHGDHSEPTTAINSKLYVRPVMFPRQDRSGRWAEQLPLARLFADLLIRAVERMKVGDSETGEAPTASNVKIINLAIGDPDRPFFYNLGIWAKVLDWLSYKHNVLFLVSAGNETSPLVIPSKKANGNPLTIAERAIELYQKIADERINRRILSPGESINALTVGALNADKSGDSQEIYDDRLLMNKETLPAPYSRIGNGFDRAVKPEVFFPGGKVLGRENRIKPEIKVYYPDNWAKPPGIKSAMPGQNAALNAEGYSIGTSNSTALATRHAIHLHQMLDELNGKTPGSIPEEYFSVMIKALMVHGTHWGKADEIFRSFLSRQAIDKKIHPFIGYGKVFESYSLFSTDQRVTILGFGKLQKEEMHEFSIPLPEALSSQKIEKHVILTLAWFSPLNFQSSKYRQAYLSLENIETAKDAELKLEHDIYDFYSTRNGTVQHLVLKGNKADPFIEGAELKIRVSCKEDASGLAKATQIPYAIAATFAIPVQSTINIYEQIQVRLQQRVKVSANA